MSREINKLTGDNKTLKATVEAQDVQLKKYKKEQSSIEAQRDQALSELKQVKDELSQLVEQNHNLKLENMKTSRSSQDSFDDQLVTKFEQANTQIQNLENQLEETRLKRSEDRQKLVQLDSDLIQTNQQCQKLKDQNQELLKQLQELEQSNLSLKQEMESNIFLNHLIKSDNKNEVDQLIQRKNDEIQQLSSQLQENRGRLMELESDIENKTSQLSRGENENTYLSGENAALTSELKNLQQKVKVMEADLMKAEAAPRSSSTSVNMGIVLKDLEDGKNLIEKKNTEIMQLRKTQKEQEEKIGDLLQENQQIKLNMEQFQQENKDFHMIMRRSSSTSMESSQNNSLLQDDILLLLSDPDTKRRTAARNLKSKLDSLEKELIFRQTDSEIKREQLQPFKERAALLQFQVETLCNQVSELQLQVAQKDDLIGELEKKQEQLETNQLIPLQSQKAMETSMTIGNRPQLRINEQQGEKGDKLILSENQQSCSGDNGCRLF